MTDTRGPGRPRLHDEETTRPYSVSLTPSEADTLREWGNGNLTEGLRRAMETRTMTTASITVENATRSRKWGFGYSTKPTGNGPYSIEMPTAPEYTGTIRQVEEQIENDRFLASLKGGTLHTTAFFYDGKRIVNEQEFNWWREAVYQQRTFKDAPAAPDSVKLVFAAD